MKPDGGRRVVVTGLGVITSLGSDLDGFWSGLLEGRSGVRRITQFDASNLPCQIAGEIPEFDPEAYMDAKDVRRTSRASQISLAVAQLAVADSGFQVGASDPERVGVYVGTAIGGIERLEDGISVLRGKGAYRLNPFITTSVLPNMLAFHVGHHFKVFGPSSTITTACATGTQVVGEAAEAIRHGRADVIIACAAEALITDYALGGFAAMRALPTHFNDEPTRASRPFDADREGFVFSEGAACLLLESLESARNRGARIYAEISGYAASSEGYHIAAPDPTAAGAVRTMRWALEDAGVSPEQVDYINAHGTSTPVNDAVETLAIKTLFGERAFQIPVSSTKSMLGHAMGASGAIEAVVCALSIQRGQIHPTINYETPDPECDLDYVPNLARAAPISTALSNSFGLGGQNACLVLSRMEV
ncbi:MAG: beta-ketoacyl-ACP synthase II [Anaerolineales bacterium]